MTIKTMEFLSAALSLVEVEHERREDYSGRRMYGKTTCGLVLDDPTALIGAVAAYMSSGSEPPNDLIESEGFRTDDMGKSTIIY